MRLLVPLLLALCLSGCGAFIWPHRVQHTPEISGIVLSDGAPVAGARIYVHHSLSAEQCGPSKISATTDLEGKFAFTGRKEVQLLVVMGDRLDRWALCIESDGRFIDGWRANGIGYPPSRSSFTCDVNAASQAGPSGRGICRAES